MLRLAVTAGVLLALFPLLVRPALAAGDGWPPTLHPWQPGELRDCEDRDGGGRPVCPRMIRIPAGKIAVGAPDDRGDRNERPRHEVSVRKPLLVSTFPLTRGEYLACVAARACRPHGSSEFRQDDSHPVVMVNFQDAEDYVQWLSRKTGKRYRLPSEAEWEYFARAGSTTAYPWGDSIGVRNATCADCGSHWDNYSTAPVGSFKPNAFGLYDVVGNVWQWAADCYHPDYQGAPLDGSAWLKGGCELRPVRGGAWNESSEDSRLSTRRGVFPQARNYDIGIRVVRDIN
jgi:formylglycine-generating enzyme required for sulfatase activity